MRGKTILAFWAMKGVGFELKVHEIDPRENGCKTDVKRAQHAGDGAARLERRLAAELERGESE